MEYINIVNSCLKAIKTFNSIIMSPESHIQSFIQKVFPVFMQVTDDSEKTFIKEVFYGFNRYEKIFEVLNDNLFKAKTSTTNRNDSTLYSVFAYLLIFRFEDLPLEELKQLLLSQDAVKMNVFLEYFFDIDVLTRDVRPGWSEIYDEDYIDNVIQGLEFKLQRIGDILCIISEKATGKRSTLAETYGNNSQLTTDEESIKLNSKKKENSSQFKPFKLTQVKPKAIPQPILIPKTIIVKGVPASTYSFNMTDLSFKNVERKEKIKEETKKKYEESKEQKFILATESRPTNLEILKKNEEKKLLQTIEYKSHYRPAKDFSEDASVRLNVAAILKEDCIYAKKKEEEAKSIKELETNMRDSTEFKMWQEKERERLRQEENEHIQRKKVEMEVSREAAMKAYEDKIQENKKKAERLKARSEKGKREIELNKRKENETKKKLVSTAIGARVNIVNEKDKVMNKNKEVHDTQKNEMFELVEMRREEEKVERRKRDEIIRQIRELERQPKERVKGFDPTETGFHFFYSVGSGLLNEMSFAELRERLSFLKIIRQEELKKKKERNLKTKSNYLQSLKYKVDNIAFEREKLKREKEIEREEKKRKMQEEEQRQKETREKSLLEVFGKISEKKREKQEEEERLAKEFKDIKMKRQYLNANQAIVEEMAWKSLQDGAERDIIKRQNDKLILNLGYESIKVKDRTIIANSAKRQLEDQISFMNEYDEILEKANKENELLNRILLEEKLVIHNSVKQFEEKHSQNMIERDSFKQKMSEKSLATAKNSKFNRSSRNELPSAKYD